MKEGKRGRRGPGSEKLALSMGESLGSDERPKDHRILKALGILGMLLLGVALDRYARDLLVLLVALLVLGFLSREVLRWVAESGLISPGWLIVAALTVALGSWFFAPGPWTKRGGSLAKYLPKPVLDYMDSSTRYKSAQANSPDVPPAPETSGGAGSSGVRPALLLSSNRSVSAAGQLVTFTARLPSPSGGPTTVRFYAGATLIGTATVAGEATVASFTTADLPPGSHEITAELVGQVATAAQRSARVPHRVTPGGGR